MLGSNMAVYLVFWLLSVMVPALARSSFCMFGHSIRLYHYLSFESAGVLMIIEDETLKEAPYGSA